MPLPTRELSVVSYVLWELSLYSVCAQRRQEMDGQRVAAVLECFFPFGLRCLFQIT